MSLTARLGQVVNLKVARITEFGYFLTDGCEDVMLHKNEAKREYTEEEDVEVFLYPDAKAELPQLIQFRLLLSIIMDGHRLQM